MKKKWSILLLVLLIMLISSLLAMLITKFAKNMILNSNELTKYYNAYYLAYWWIELQLTKINNHQMWFEDEILSWSNTIKNNFICSKNNLCSFRSIVRARSNVLIPNQEKLDNNIWNCPTKTDDYYSIWLWQGIIIPLYYDNSYWEWSLSWWLISKISKSNYLATNLNLSWNSQYSYWIAVVWDSIDVPLVYKGFWSISLKNTDYDPNKQSFLVVANISDNQESICINNSEVRLPTSNVYIDSIWKYADKTVSLQAVKKVQLDDYLIYSLVSSVAWWWDY